MITYMHCRPPGATDFSTYPSTCFLLDSSTFPCSTNLHLSSSPRRRRKLADPIVTYASNYYSTHPHLVSQTISPSVPPPPPAPSSIGRAQKKSETHGIYCDLFNLLELPETSSEPFEHRRDSRRFRHQRDFEKNNSRMKPVNDRKRPHQQTFYHKEKKRHDEKLSSIEHYERYNEKKEKINDIYQRRSPAKGFFRRVVRHYFCMPPAVSNNGYSS